MDWEKFIGSLIGSWVSGGKAPPLPRGPSLPLEYPKGKWPGAPSWPVPPGGLKDLLKIFEIIWPDDIEPPDSKTPAQTAAAKEEERRSWLTDLLITAGSTVPALLGGVLSNKATQEAYDKYSLVGARAVERAQNIAWATYQQSRQDLAPFRGGGAAAYNQYLTMLGVDPAKIIPSEQDIADTKLKFPGGPPILGAVLKPFDPIEPDPTNPNPVKPGPNDPNFNPSDYASLYRDIGDAKKSPTEGINQLKELFWGNRSDALGFGGIMGATLSGQMSLGTANTLGKYLYSRWADDMKNSGVSQSDFVRSINSQSAVKDLTNNIINLKDNGSVSINNTHYSGFNSDEAGFVTNGQETIGLGTLLYWPGDAGSDTFTDFYAKKFPNRYATYPDGRPKQPPRGLNPPTTPIIPDPDPFDKGDPSGPDPELPIGPPGTIPDPWGWPDPTQPPPVFPGFEPTPLPTGPPGGRFSGARPRLNLLSDVMSQEEENEVQEGLAGWKPPGAVTSAYTQALQDRREQDVRAAAALPPDEREAAARQAGDAMNEGEQRVNSLRDFVALEERLRGNLRLGTSSFPDPFDKGDPSGPDPELPIGPPGTTPDPWGWPDPTVPTPTFPGLEPTPLPTGPPVSGIPPAPQDVPPAGPADPSQRLVRTTPGHPYVSTTIPNKLGSDSPQKMGVLRSTISMAKFKGLDWPTERVSWDDKGNIYVVSRDVDSGSIKDPGFGRPLGKFIGDWSNIFNIVPGPGQTAFPGSDLMLGGARNLQNISDYEKIGQWPREGPIDMGYTPPVPASTLLPPTPPPVTPPPVTPPPVTPPPVTPPPVTPPPVGGGSAGLDLWNRLNRPRPQTTTPPRPQTTTPPPPQQLLPRGKQQQQIRTQHPGTIPDQYGFKTSPLYQYRKQEGEKDIRRHLSSIGHSRSTYGMNTMMKFYDKLLAEGSEQQLGRLSDAARLGLSAATASAAGAQVAGEQLARLQQSAGALQGDVAIGRGMSGASLADFLGGLPLAGLDMWNRLQK